MSSLINFAGCSLVCFGCLLLVTSGFGYALFPGSGVDIPVGIRVRDSPAVVAESLAIVSSAFGRAFI